MPKCVCEGSLDVITFRPYSTEWAGEPTERESYPLSTFSMFYLRLRLWMIQTILPFLECQGSLQQVLVLFCVAQDSLQGSKTGL